MQAFVYASKLHLSEVLWWLDEADLARTLFRQAQELKKRFNESFWMTRPCSNVSEVSQNWLSTYAPLFFGKACMPKNILHQLLS